MRGSPNNSSSSASTLIVDYGLGNLLSIERALAYIGVNARVTADPGDLARARRIILPGVGSFATASSALFDRGFAAEVLESATRGVPILGICLGMQILFDEGLEDGHHPGLGLIAGRVERVFSSNSDGLPRTHIGWRRLTMSSDREPSPTQDEMWRGRFYFVHSFRAVPIDNSVVEASVRYGSVQIPAVVRHGNVQGFQFHPEKSGPAGLALLKKFCS